MHVAQAYHEGIYRGGGPFELRRSEQFVPSSERREQSWNARDRSYEAGEEGGESFREPEEDVRQELARLTELYRTGGLRNWADWRAEQAGSLGLTRPPVLRSQDAREMQFQREAEEATGRPGRNGRGDDGRRREARLRPFNEKEVTWPDYLVQFEAVAAWNGWTKPERAMQLVAALSGRATSFLAGLSTRQKLDYDYLLQRLTARFDPVSQATAVRAELRLRQRRKNETLSEFGEEVRQMIIRAYSTWDTAAREDLAVERFIDGLTDRDQQRHVTLAAPTTLTAAITTAAHFENVVKRHAPVAVPKPPKVEWQVFPEKRRVQAVGNQTEADLAGAVTAALKPFMQQLEVVLKSCSNRPEPMPQAPCRPPAGPRGGARAGRGQPPPGKTGRAGPDGGRRCWTCGEEGHFSRECPRPKPPKVAGADELPPYEASEAYEDAQEEESIYEESQGNE
jgi:hypothetical protein